LLRSAVIVGVLVIVFGFILPQAIDYRAVLEAFQRLDAVQIAVISVLGIAAWFVAGSAIMVVMEGLTLLRGATSWIVLSGIGSSIPFGPWNLGVLWIVVRDWGVSNRAATSGIAVYGIVNVLSYLFLPLVAAAFLTVTGGFTETGNPALAWLISISIGVIALAIFGLLVGIARSERVASWVARTGQRIADGIFHRLGRHLVPDVEAAVVNFSEQLGGVVRRRGLAALGLAVISQVMWVVVLVAALRIVGVSEESLPASWILAAAAIVAVVNIIPISPGGAGLPEIMFISILSALAPEVSSADIAAGIFLYRLYFWFLPIPISWISLKLIRRGKSMLPTGDELRSYAASDGATG
jgi:uncharacterized membrane protein YbhN (UPF0104 family)